MVMTLANVCSRKCPLSRIALVGFLGKVEEGVGGLFVSYLGESWSNLTWEVNGSKRKQCYLR